MGESLERAVDLPRDPVERAALLDAAGLTDAEKEAVERFLEGFRTWEQYTIDDPPPWIRSLLLLSPAHPAEAPAQEEDR